MRRQVVRELSEERGPELGRRVSKTRRGGTDRTLFRNPAYPLLSCPESSGLTPNRIIPQNLPVALLPTSLFTSCLSSSSKFTVDIPPMSASHPVAI